MGLNIEMAKKAEARAQELSEIRGLPAELCLGQAYDELMAELLDSENEEEEEED
jgi:hypothetical protein